MFRNLIGALVGLAFFGMTGTVNASLIGTNVMASGFLMNPTAAVVGVGTEFTQSDIGIDLTADQLIITHTVDHGHGFSSTFTATLSNLFWNNDPSAGEIIGLDIVSANDVPGGLLPSITFTASSITFSIGGTWFSDGQATWDIRTSHAVPEPSTLAIFAFSLAGLGFVTRRRRTGVGKPRHAS